MLTAGVDVGTSGARAVVIDVANGSVIAHAEIDVLSGRRTRDGGHRIDDAAIVDAALRVLSRACTTARVTPAAVSVAGTAGTLCFRDAQGDPCAPGVAYDDPRFGTGLERVAEWHRLVPGAARVVPLTDAVLEALGAGSGATDWTNALKLGWDARRLQWPDAARSLELSGFVPRADPPGGVAGVCSLEAARGAVLARGATDSCAMHLAAAGLDDGAWSLSLGTTVTWKAAIPCDTTTVVDRLPRGAYGHRIATDVWLAAAAGNSGGGVLRTKTPVGELDRRAAFPSGFAAYPLARPGDRFPVADPAFAGFGVPHVCDRRRHAALLEGVAFVARLGIERLAGTGVTPPQTVAVTGGGARSLVWMRVLASVLDVTVVAKPDSGPAIGAALLAAAAADRAHVKEIVAGVPAAQATTHAPEAALARELGERFQAFVETLMQVAP